MKRFTIVFFIILLFLNGCTILPFVNDKNNITDWISIPKEDVEYRFATRDRFEWDDEWNTGSYDILITDIDEKSDAILIEYSKNDSDNRDYIIVDKIENAIATSGDDYYDEDDDFVFLKTPIEVGNDWRTDEYDFEIISTDTTVEVEAGEYKGCMAIEFDNGGSLEGIIIYSPTLGINIYIEKETDVYHYIEELERIRE